MAIAYYIPDQAKLLAGRHPRRENSNNNSQSPANSQQSSRLQQTARVTQTANSTPAENRGYGTTINISVPTYTTTPQEPLGCWDFLTQVFCHALRFYHESSQLQPTVIQISVNFNADATAASTTTTTATVNTTTSDTTATSTSTTTATATYSTPNDEIDIYTDPKQTESSKRKN